jgi:parallel beta-helix repeat protein
MAVDGYAVVRGMTLKARGTQVGAGPNHAALRITQGQLLVENCSLSSAAGDAVVITGETAFPILRASHVHDAKQVGVRVQKRARVEIEGCEISGNASRGISIEATGNVVVRGSRILNNRQWDVYTATGGMGEFTDCTASRVKADKGGRIVGLRPTPPPPGNPAPKPSRRPTSKPRNGIHKGGRR